MQDLVERVNNSKKKISELIQHVDLDSRKNELAAAQKESENPNLWDEPEKAQKLMKKINDLQAEINSWDLLSKKADDVMELAEMDDEAMRGELENEIGEIATLLSGKFDRGNAILAIHAGAGGTEAHDWASMLQRMYLRWIEAHGYDCEIVDFTPGEEAGTKTITITVSGQFAYGYLKSEKGTHRLVRLSPFDAAHRRHTSFAMVEVLPEAEDDDSIEIPESDLRKRSEELYCGTPASYSDRNYRYMSE